MPTKCHNGVKNLKEFSGRAWWVLGPWTIMVMRFVLLGFLDGKTLRGLCRTKLERYAFKMFVNWEPWTIYSILKSIFYLRRLKSIPDHHEWWWLRIPGSKYAPGWWLKAFVNICLWKIFFMLRANLSWTVCSGSPRRSLKMVGRCTDW